jgi:hypothetical protein
VLRKAQGEVRVVVGGKARVEPDDVPRLPCWSSGRHQELANTCTLTHEHLDTRTENEHRVFWCCELAAFLLNIKRFYRL